MCAHLLVCIIVHCIKLYTSVSPKLGQFVQFLRCMHAQSQSTGNLQRPMKILFNIMQKYLHGRAVRDKITIQNTKYI